MVRELRRLPVYYNIRAVDVFLKTEERSTVQGRRHD
jgi:hypothetical protein